MKTVAFENKQVRSVVQVASAWTNERAATKCRMNTCCRLSLVGPDVELRSFSLLLGGEHRPPSLARANHFVCVSTKRVLVQWPTEDSR